MRTLTFPMDLLPWTWGFPDYSMLTANSIFVVVQNKQRTGWAKKTPTFFQSQVTQLVVQVSTYRLKHGKLQFILCPVPPTTILGDLLFPVIRLRRAAIHKARM